MLVSHRPAVTGVRRRLWAVRGMPGSDSYVRCVQGVRRVAVTSVCRTAATGLRRMTVTGVRCTAMTRVACRVRIACKC
jgi:hypothetical protein